jgi:hypothetical protein
MFASPTTELPKAVARPPRQRDARIDVIRGFALLTIFVDHIPRNAPALLTLHNFGFSDAAEIFVLLAGYSAMVAYGGLFQRAGIRTTLVRVARRCLRIYLFQASLLLATLLIVRAWMDLTGLIPRFGVRALLDMGLVPGLLRGLMLNALPNYLDILPLYILLLFSFPLSISDCDGAYGACLPCQAQFGSQRMSTTASTFPMRQRSTTVGTSTRSHGSFCS